MNDNMTTIPIDEGMCDITITWATGWKFTAKGLCFQIGASHGTLNTELYSLHDCKFYPPNIEGEKSYDEASR